LTAIYWKMVDSNPC